MPDDRNTPPHPGPSPDDLLAASRTALEQAGQVLVGSGRILRGPWELHLHTDYGPPGQDKEINQDYALAWSAGREGPECPVRLAAALADGVTSSDRSEWAAMLACWAALGALAGSGPDVSPRMRAEEAIGSAGRAIAAAAEEMTRDPAASRPPDQFESTWRYILSKGAFLETTLTLLWIEQETLHLAIVGDGGAAWRVYPAPVAGPTTAEDRVVARCDLATQHVRALGPGPRPAADLDHWEALPMEHPFLAAFYTDGIGRGIENDPGPLFERVERLADEGAENLARAYIEGAIRDWPRRFEDNLTLALLRNTEETRG